MYSDIKTKTDRRSRKRKNKEDKWVKHGFGENWGKSHGNNISKEMKKILKKKTKK